MTVNLTPTPVVLPGAVAIPADGDAVNSAGIAAYMQPALNGIKYTQDNITTKFLTAGSLASTPANMGFDFNLQAWNVVSDASVGGRFIGRRQLSVYAMPDSDQTVLAKNYDVISVYYGTVLTLNRTVTIDPTGCGEGDVLQVFNNNSIRTLIVNGVSPAGQQLQSTSSGVPG